MNEDFQMTGKCNLALTKKHFSGTLYGAWGISKRNPITEQMSQAWEIVQNIA